MSEYMNPHERRRFELVPEEPGEEDESRRDEKISSQRMKSMNNKRFKKEYMSIPKFAKWLQGVDGDEKRFFCTYCEKDFLGGKWEINKHLNSSKHQKNGEKFEILDPTICKTEEERKMILIQVNNNHKRFKDEYLNIPGCQGWLQKVPEDKKKFACKLCEKEMVGGKWEVMKHLRSKKHQQTAEKANRFGEIEADDLMEFEEGNMEMLEDTDNFSVEIEEQEEYLKYEDDLEDPYQQQNVEQVKVDELPPTIIDEITDIFETDNSEYCDFNTLLENLYRDSFNSYDVALHSFDGTIRAHRCVLAASSEFFRELFKSSVHFEIEPVINVYLPDYSSTSIQLLVKFIYSGQVFIAPESVNEFSDLCHELNINTINSNFENSWKNREEHQEYDQVIEDLSNSLNCKKISIQLEEPPIETPESAISNCSSDLEELDDDFLAYQNFRRKKLKKKKGKLIEKRMDMALIEVLAGEDTSTAAKKFQINNNELVGYVNRYKNIQQMSSAIGVRNPNHTVDSIPALYKIKRAAQDEDKTSEQDLFNIQNKCWEYQNSNRPTNSGFVPMIVNSSENLRISKHLSINSACQIHSQIAPFKVLSNKD